MSITRRKFFGNMAVLGAGASLNQDLYHHNGQGLGNQSLPREVWIATTSLDDLEPVNYDAATDRMLNILEEVIPLSPDIICLPETFPNSAIKQPEPSMERVAADFTTGEDFRKFSNFARTNMCYMILPIYKKEGNKFYNSALLIGRDGKIQGDYKKIHPTEGEIDMGIVPGPLDPPVFETDFGMIGIQICFDIHWRDGWRRLSRKGAEIIFWPSAFGGGEMINTAAWQGRAVVVSSTIKGISKICDMNGKALNYTGFWNKNWACAPVNLEKKFLTLYPYIHEMPAIQKKYGRKVHIEVYHEEEWIIIESLSEDVKVVDIMDEFNLRTYEQHMVSSNEKQLRARP